MHLQLQYLHTDVHIQSLLVRAMCFLMGGAIVPPIIASESPNALVTVILAAHERKAQWVSFIPLSGTAPSKTHFDPPDGKVEVLLPPNDPVLVCAGAAGAATQCRTILPGRESDCYFVLTPGHTVRGFIAMEEPLPLRGILVRVRLAQLHSRRPVILPIERVQDSFIVGIDADPSGSFEFCHLAPGEYTLEVALPGGRVHETEIISVPDLWDVPTVITVPPVVVPGGVDLLISVMTVDGVAVSAASVGASQPAGESARATMFQGTADVDGRIRFRGLHPSLPLVVGCSAEGLVRAQIEFSSPPETVTCQLRTFAEVRGSVTTDTEAPVQGAQVSIARITATTDNAGNFVIRQVPPGAWNLSVTAPGYAKLQRAVTVAEAETQEIADLILQPADEARGKVIDDATGEPIVGARVELLDRSDVTAIADEDGRFAIAVDGPNDRIRVSAAAYADRDVTLGVDEETIVRLVQPGSIRVQVWRDDGGDDVCAACTVNISTDNRQHSALTDGTGVVLFQGLPPGVYYVSRETARVGSLSISISGGDGKHVSVASDVMSSVELGRRPIGELRVYVAPEPDASWQLIAASPSGSAVGVRQVDGSFSIPYRPDVEAALQLSRGDVSVRIGTLAPAVAGSAVHLALGGGGVRIAFASDSSVTQMCEVRSVSGAVSAWGWLRVNAVLEVPFLKPGTYVVTAGGRAVGGPFTIHANEWVSVRVNELNAAASSGHQHATSSKPI